MPATSSRLNRGQGLAAVWDRNRASSAELLHQDCPCRRVRGAPARFLVLARIHTPRATFSSSDLARSGALPRAGDLLVWVTPQGPRGASGSKSARIRNVDSNHKLLGLPKRRRGRAPRGCRPPGSAPRTLHAARRRLRVLALVLGRFACVSADRTARRGRSGGLSAAPRAAAQHVGIFKICLIS